MLQAAGQRGKEIVKVTIPAGILDITAMPCFLSMQHSFETGNRHLTIETKLKTPAQVADNLDLDGFTVPYKIGQDVSKINGALIGLLMYEQGHTIGFNPTARQIELTLEIAWFSSTAEYKGGAKRPDPPSDGGMYSYHPATRKWRRHGQAGRRVSDPTEPGSAHELCELMDGAPQVAFL